MTHDDLTEFRSALTDMMSVLSAGKHAPAPAHIAMWFRVLEPWPLAAVTQAMTAHMRTPSTGRTLPIPSDIVAQLEGFAADDGRPGADEAWAVAIAARDEAATVVWTDEMAEAWRAASAVLAVGDEVGARMAFRAAYEAAVKRSRASGRPVRWMATLGHDEARRTEALQAAIALGRTPTDGASADVLSLPAPGVAGLLPWATPAAGDSEVAAAAKRRALAAMRVLRGRIGNQRDELDTSDRDRTAIRKASSAAAVSEYQRGPTHEQA